VLENKEHLSAAHLVGVCNDCHSSSENYDIIFLKGGPSWKGYFHLGKLALAVAVLLLVIHQDPYPFIVLWPLAITLMRPFFVQASGSEVVNRIAVRFAWLHMSAGAALTTFLLFLMYER